MRTRNGWNNWPHTQLTIEPSIDRFIARAFDVPVWSGGADVQELADSAIITLDVPGVKPEQINVSAEHRTLTVKIERDGHQPVCAPVHHRHQVRSRTRECQAGARRADAVAAEGRRSARAHGAGDRRVSDVSSRGSVATEGSRTG